MLGMNWETALLVLLMSTWIGAHVFVLIRTSKRLKSDGCFDG